MPINTGVKVSTQRVRASKPAPLLLSTSISKEVRLITAGTIRKSSERSLNIITRVVIIEWPRVRLMKLPRHLTRLSEEHKLIGILKIRKMSNLLITDFFLKEWTYRNRDCQRSSI
jgi:hypothetical protein